MSRLGSTLGELSPIANCRYSHINKDESLLRQHFPSNAWLEISTSAFLHNIIVMRNYLGNNSNLCVIMKADAYGHGINILMPIVIACGISCVGIASNQEAKTVRANGYRGQLIRVRTATLSEVEDALAYQVEELVGNMGNAQQISNIALCHHQKIPVHLVINSAGMSRNGLELATAQGKNDAIAIATLPGLQIIGIMTHFPREDKEEILNYLALFNQQAVWLMEAAGLDRSKLQLHAANSFTALEVPEAHLDLVRAGCVLYGDMVPPHTEFRHVMQFKTSVAAVNVYPAGNSVGYSREYTLTRNSLLANIPVGYSDGYHRLLSYGGYVLVKGQRAPIVGRISMNTFMADVTDIEDVVIGDEVVLFGKQGEAEVIQYELEGVNRGRLADLYTMWGIANPRVVVG